MSKDERKITVSLKMVVGPETAVELVLFSRLVERVAVAGSQSAEIAAIRQFADDLREAKAAQAKLQNLVGGKACDCPICELKQGLRDVVKPRASQPESLLSWSNVLVKFMRDGKLREAQKANEQFGNSDLTVADFAAAGVTAPDCQLLRMVMDPGAYYPGTSPAEPEAPAAAQEEAQPATA